MVAPLPKRWSNRAADSAASRVHPASASDVRVASHDAGWTTMSTSPKSRTFGVGVVEMSERWALGQPPRHPAASSRSPFVRPDLRPSPNDELLVPELADLVACGIADGDGVGFDGGVKQPAEPIHRRDTDEFGYFVVSDDDGPYG